MLIFLIRDRQTAGMRKHRFHVVTMHPQLHVSLISCITTGLCRATRTTGCTLAVDEIRIRPSTATRDLCMSYGFLTGSSAGAVGEILMQSFSCLSSGFWLLDHCCHVCSSPGSGTTHQVVFPACRQQQKRFFPGFQMKLHKLRCGAIRASASWFTASP